MVSVAPSFSIGCSALVTLWTRLAAWRLIYDGDMVLAPDVARRRLRDLWDNPLGNYVFLWTVGVPLGPFLLPQSWGEP